MNIAPVPANGTAIDGTHVVFNVYMTIVSPLLIPASFDSFQRLWVQTLIAGHFGVADGDVYLVDISDSDIGAVVNRRRLLDVGMWWQVFVPGNETGVVLDARILKQSIEADVLQQTGFVVIIHVERLAVVAPPLLLSSTVDGDGEGDEDEKTKKWDIVSWCFGWFGRGLEGNEEGVE